MISCRARYFFCIISIPKHKFKTYTTINLPVVLFECDNSSFTLKEELKIRLFEKNGLRGTFVSKMEEVTRKWKKPRSEGLSDMNSLPNIVLYTAVT